MLLMNCPYFERQKMFFDFDGFGLYRRSAAPSSEGAWDVCITASAVVGLFMQANENSMSL